MSNGYHRQTVAEEMESEKDKYFALEDSLRRWIRALAYVASLASTTLLVILFGLDRYWLVWIPAVGLAVVIAHTVSTILRQELVQYGRHINRFSFLGGRDVGRKESSKSE